MPIYEYQCPCCQSVFEEWQSGFDEQDMACPDCGKESKRLISQTSFHLKGGGWYADGYGDAKAADAGSGSKKSDAARPCAKGGDAPAAPAPKPAPDASSAGSAD